MKLFYFVFYLVISQEVLGMAMGMYFRFENDFETSVYSIWSMEQIMQRFECFEQIVKNIDLVFPGASLEQVRKSPQYGMLYHYYKYINRTLCQSET